MATLQTFGGGTTDFILDPGNDAKPLSNAPYTVIDGVTMLPASGLTDANGIAVTQLRSDADGRYAGSALLEGSTYWLDCVGARGPFRAGPQVSTTALAEVVAMGPQLNTIAASAAASAFSAKQAQAAAEAVQTGAATTDASKLVTGTLAAARLPDLSGTYASASALALKADTSALAAKADASALTSKVDKGAMVYNVKDYGAKGDGATDDDAAIQAAQTAAGFRPLYFPNGTYNFSTKLTAQNITGENRQKTILNYTGTGTALGVVTSGAASYHRRVSSLSIKGTGTGTGIDIDAGSAGLYLNLLIQGFTQGVWIHAPAGGQSLYNNFIDVTADTVATGYRLDDASHENKFIACRVNGATSRGYDIRSGGHNVIQSGAIENAITGVSLTEPGNNLTRANIIAFNRFEYCTTNVVVNTGVQLTGYVFNREVGGAYTDNGTGTVKLDMNSGALQAGRNATAPRPTAAAVGVGGMIYDTTLGKPIWSTGSAFKDATGTTV